MGTDMLLVENKLGFSAWHRNGASKGLNPGARDMHSRVMNSVIVGSTRGICGHTGLAPSTFYGGTEPFRPNQIGDSPSIMGGTVWEDVEFRSFGNSSSLGLYDPPPVKPILLECTTFPKGFSMTESYSGLPYHSQGYVGCMMPRNWPPATALSRK